MSYAFGYAGACQIQLIQQHDDKQSIYRDMYPDGSFGMHHIAMLVEDYAKQRQYLLDQGLEKSCELYADGV
ncbi:MAG: methylmalonyl-CoA epimerase, partial [Gammaproteobacteria bacterium]|nr:methylmalonyl-CoA epimerase [Gammaproteobacteria bacterium]